MEGSLHWPQLIISGWNSSIWRVISYRLYLQQKRNKKLCTCHVMSMVQKLCHVHGSKLVFWSFCWSLYSVQYTFREFFWLLLKARSAHCAPSLLPDGQPALSCLLWAPRSGDYGFVWYRPQRGRCFEPPRLKGLYKYFITFFNDFMISSYTNLGLIGALMLFKMWF